MAAANNNNLSVLTALDTARTQWYHVSTIVIAGMCFFTDTYDLFCISTISKLLGRLYYFDPNSDKPGQLPHSVNNAVLIGMALVGTLTGQLTFGYLGDKLGRKKVYGVTLILMLLGTMSTWFLLDIAFYSQNLTQKDIFPAMGFTNKAEHVSALREMFETSRAMFVVALFGNYSDF